MRSWGSMETDAKGGAMKRFVALLFGLLACGAAAQGPDVGLANSVSGSVTFTAPGSPARPLAAFAKVRDGDRIDLAAGAQVRVVFFEGSRQERWAGPASFVARSGGSAPISGKPAETTTLPADVSQRISKVPD